MTTIGYVGLALAFICAAAAIVVLAAPFALPKHPLSKQAARAGHILVPLSLACLTVCCAVLVYAFAVNDFSIYYVVNEHSDSTDSLAWLYKLSGLWAGREGSLLFWAWLIALFASVVGLRNLRRQELLDSAALLVLSIVLAAFVGVMLFSSINMPFTPTPSAFLNDDGSLVDNAKHLGMSPLLEHWAMAIHPPTLFVGYAGLTVPFAFALAALITADTSSRWAEKSQRYTIFSWLFLGIGIGLGANWAYVVLGWGGYWGWDPVENASLLPWLMGVALIHSLTVCRQRGAFRRWGILCACITFAFVIVGTFISRSGLVQSVHAFEGDPVSLGLFGSLIVISVAAGAVGLWLRRGVFAQAVKPQEIQSMVSRDAAFYFNNVFMVLASVILAYLTISAALPSFMPFGGESVSAGTYALIARPLGVVYLAILALCPLLSWGKTDKAAFLKRAKVPGLCALVLFIVLMVYFATYLLPCYNATIAAGGSTAEDLLAQGPSIYYNGVAVVGFAVASCLVFNALFLLIRTRGKGNIGGFVTHLGMGVILIGLIGSTMYVTEVTPALPYDEDANVCTEDASVQDYTLKFVNTDADISENQDDYFYHLYLDVYRNGEKLGSVTPTIQVIKSTQQQRLLASVVTEPLQDLFVVYEGLDSNDDLSLEVRINPLIMFVWIGFGLMMAGTLIAVLRRPSRTCDNSQQQQ